jgi:hypothetical protein
MNWIERVAKILRDKVVFTVGGQKPTNGDINMGAYALLADVVVKNGGLPATTQRLDSTYDLDTILDAGIYYVEVAKNQPTPGNGTLLVIGNNLKDSDRRATQLYFADTLTGSYTYHRNVGYTHQTDAEAMKEWSPWVVDATSADINALNNIINDLKAQISGGGVNLLDVTNGESGNLSGNDGSLLDGFKNLYRTPNMIPVTDKVTYLLNVATPGDEKPVIEKVCFYDANGIFTRKSFAQAIRFGFTPQNGECFIRFTIVSTQATPGFPDDASWPKYGVTLTVTNSLETRLAALESKINGGTTA